MSQNYTSPLEDMRFLLDAFDYQGTIGALPFAVMMALVLAFVFLFPSLATALL